jgi:hypothetical protein
MSVIFPRTETWIVDQIVVWPTAGTPSERKRKEECDARTFPYSFITEPLSWIVVISMFCSYFVISLLAIANVHEPLKHWHHMLDVSINGAAEK